ncbi:MAG: hypothetical protein K2J80_09425 [Oscillospiraceae bacterium]|nr:hypothetical protein [Oscillospiraceae bacterium]
MNDVMEHLADDKVRRGLSMMAAVRLTARELLLREGFEEIDTPILMPRTGEIYNDTFDLVLEGKEAMLADSPQIYKMLLCKAGYVKHFRFAHCFRSITRENNLCTRLSEFVQLDLELRNTDLDDLIRLAETLISEICCALHKPLKISRMRGLECRAAYGEEMCPDLREKEDEISLVIVENMPLTNNGKTPCHHIFALPSDIERLCCTDKLTELTTISFDLVMNGIEIGGGDMRVNERRLQTELMRLFNVDEKRYAGYLETLETDDHSSRGGFAVGLERMVMALSGAEDISDVTAFPDYYKRGVN